jgi:hypothetical protein
MPMKSRFATIFFATVMGLLFVVEAEAGDLIAQSDSGASNHGSHSHASHSHGDMVNLPKGENAPSLDFTITEDSVGGYNVHILVENFRFAPEHVNASHRDGEGHAHIYVNGEKIARVYGEWFHLSSLPPGDTEVMVTLNANDHGHLAVEGEPLSTVKVVSVPN